MVSQDNKLCKYSKVDYGWKHQSTLDIRLQRADGIIFLDMPVHLCLFRVLRRIFKYYCLVCPGMPNNCRERFDINFLKYVIQYNKVSKKRLLLTINENRPIIKFITLHGRKEVANFLATLTME